MTFLHKFTIKQKVALIGFISIIGYLLIMFMDLSLERKILYDQRKKELIHITTLGKKVLQNIYKLQRDHSMDEAQAKQLAIRVIRNLHFGDKNLFFLIDEKGDYLTYKLREELDEIGESNDILEQIIKESYKNNNIIKHKSFRNGTVKEKLSITSRFEPWGWLIGAGIFVEDIEATFFENVLKEGILLCPLILLICLTILKVSHCISQSIGNIFNELTELTGRKIRSRYPQGKYSELERVHFALKVVKEMTHDLQFSLKRENMLNKRLKKNNEELEDFSSIISHDLQTPVRKIALHASILKKEYDKLPELKRDEHIDYILSSSFKMKTLLFELLEFARIGSSQLSLQTVNLERCLTEAVRENDIYFERGKFHLVHEDLPQVQTDPLLITHVFSNLINNSIKYSAEDRDLEIMIRCEELEKYWILRFSDNGIGITPTDVPILFRPFRRGNKKNVKGKGLGLAICRRILAKLNGALWVNKSYKKGAQFVILLPKIIESSLSPKSISTEGRK